MASIRYERVYVLRLRNGKYYVGSTLREIETRYAEHEMGYGSRWTSRNEPHRVVCWMRVPDGYSDRVENEMTRYLMWKHGWGKVRGGKWVFLVCPQRWCPTRCGHFTRLTYFDCMLGP